ncbi:hypothetical protein [Lentzea sp. E54]|uniref:hypothetical protein n=1 Tax=Lentzea xerophila TaxID=3435883 RepID=UPI003DA55C90
MCHEHVDFYLDTGQLARWIGSLAEICHVDIPSPTDKCAVDVKLAAVFAAEQRDRYTAAVATLLDDRAAQGDFAIASDHLSEPKWPWRAATSAGWYACTFARGRVLISRDGGPWSEPILPVAKENATSEPPADLPVLGDTEPKTADFDYNFKGFSIPITQKMQPIPPTYLEHRANVAATVADATELVIRRRLPLADLTAAAIRSVVRELMLPGGGPHRYVFPENASFAYERVVTSLNFLIDADRYAENNNPEDGEKLLVSAADVAAQAVTAHGTNRPRPR